LLPAVPEHGGTKASTFRISLCRAESSRQNSAGDHLRRYRRARCSGIQPKRLLEREFKDGCGGLAVLEIHLAGEVFRSREGEGHQKRGG